MVAEEKPMDNTAINKNMDDKTQETLPEIEPKKPDEQGGIHVESHVKIFDPESQEVFVNGRA